MRASWIVGYAGESETVMNTAAQGVTNVRTTLRAPKKSKRTLKCLDDFDVCYRKSAAIDKEVFKRGAHNAAFSLPSSSLRLGRRPYGFSAYQVISLSAVPIVQEPKKPRVPLMCPLRFMKTSDFTPSLEYLSQANQP